MQSQLPASGKIMGNHSHRYSPVADLIGFSKSTSSTVVYILEVRTVGNKQRLCKSLYQHKMILIEKQNPAPPVPTAVS